MFVILIMAGSPAGPILFLFLGPRFSFITPSSTRWRRADRPCTKSASYSTAKSARNSLQPQTTSVAPAGKHTTGTSPLRPIAKWNTSCKVPPALEALSTRLQQYVASLTRRQAPRCWTRSLLEDRLPGSSWTFVKGRVRFICSREMSTWEGWPGIYMFRFG
jgi:hypothetical protein